jgi:hypothetical protein
MAASPTPAPSAGAKAVAAKKAAAKQPIVPQKQAGKDPYSQYKSGNFNGFSMKGPKG